jgi:hypothetical protein
MVQNDQIVNEGANSVSECQVLKQPLFILLHPNHLSQADYQNSVAEISSIGPDKGILCYVFKEVNSNVSFLRRSNSYQQRFLQL